MAGGKREPAGLDIRAEKPRYFRKLAELIYGSPPDAKSIASLVNALLPMVEKLLDVHAGASDMNGAKRKSQTPLIQSESPEKNGKLLQFMDSKKTKTLE
jgi:hypothetical protein